jgi:DNA mismatch repair protein MutS2
MIEGGVDLLSLQLLEFDRAREAVSLRAESSRARERLAGWLPLTDRAERDAENATLAEALDRQQAPGAWCVVAPGDLSARLDPESPELLDGEGLVEVLGWLTAAAETGRCWQDETSKQRWSRLAALAAELPDLSALETRLARSLEPDGRLRDSASPELARARAESARSERELERRLERWSREFGESAYVTRHAERFVVLVPAAGFQRRRGIVHDVSGSGQSLFVEPLEVCEGNNHLLELRARITEEERRILRELAQLVHASEPAMAELERVLIRFDTLRARARWGSDLGAIALAPGGARRRLIGARPPLRVAARGPEHVVALDLDLETSGRLLLVSGPNMGGKTVLLKTVGLSAVLAHAGFPVPAKEGSEIPELDAVLVDLGDAQSVDQGLSTFAAHLQRLVRMAEEAGSRHLLLCDELGAGTDPEEGAALGRALVERFAARGAWGVITTHLGSLKRVAGEVPGVVNGSLEFDEVNLTSSYRFLPGVPGASHALTVAGRLGLPADVLARARELAPAEAVALERLLMDLAATRRRWEDETRSLVVAKAAADEAARRHAETGEETRRTLAELRRRLTTESEAVLAQARALWQTVQREARRAEKSRGSTDDLKSRLESVERDVESLNQQARGALAAAGGEDAPAALSAAELAVGHKVRITDLGVDAEIVSGPDTDGRVHLKRGTWSIQSHIDRLARIEGGPTHDADVRPRVNWEASDDAQPLEVNLVGLDSGEAIRMLDQGLDRAVVSGLNELRIVHGIGRGVLRAAVERHLREHPQVASQRLGVVGEGGRGVTVARLR